ncbi:MFS transporter [Klenkia taihuensis]|uniref:Major Facilitator Superfamily protein n=1 Tax=Klenkia taihuensis TaxID=1225127 RepID=A0A1I1R6K6_9ACTN|nr:MFS transporter [Klenkia taihuensis]GHE07202.1 tetracycline resistance protein [Klenkia taihuensis]SFD29902.1 Major Facilitator Superfamily protein [Klenkia taihuensis]
MVTAPDVEATRAAVQRRTLTVVVCAQVLGGAGLAAGVTVGALLAGQMLGTDSSAGVPTALFTLGSALAAFLVGRVSQRRGRRAGLSAGFAVGGLGAAGVVVAAAVDSVPLLFLALFVYGSGTATNLQARYAGTDLADPARRGRAVSTALVSTTAGAVAGPNLVQPLGGLATAWGLPALAGPFLLAAVAYTAAAAAFVLLLRPDPLLWARQHPVTAPTAPGAAAEPARPASLARLGAAVMVLTQVAMVAVMTMTPVHMRDHQHGLGDVGLVIGLHIAAMYLPSPVTGWLVDRVGRSATTAAAGVVLAGSGVVAALAPGDSLGATILALVLLGLGWNLGLVSGTALVIDGTAPGTRARTQGSIDVLIALSGAAAGVLSGVVVSAAGYAVLALTASVLAVAVLLVALAARTRPVAPAR